MEKKSFLFTVKYLTPDFNQEAPPSSAGWHPPRGKDAYTVEPASLFRWDGVGIEDLAPSVNMESPPKSVVSDSKRPQHIGAATVFVKDHSAEELFAVNHDVTKQKVTKSEEWKGLTFDNKKVGPGKNNCSDWWSKISLVEERTKVAAKGPAWVRELLGPYYDGKRTDRNVQGLTGFPPLLLAVAALSCDSDKVRIALKGSIHRDRRGPHDYGNCRGTKTLFG